MVFLVQTLKDRSRATRVHAGCACRPDPSVAGRCESSPSSRTVPTSGKYWSTSGQRQSRRASPQHAGRLCGTSTMRRWAMVLMWSRTGTIRHNRRQNLRSISASVGRGVAVVWPMPRGRLRPSPPKTGHTEKSRATGPEQSPKQTPICRLVMPQPRAMILLMRSDFLSVHQTARRYGDTRPSIKIVSAHKERGAGQRNKNF
jgi:hypothetical protein